MAQTPAQPSRPVTKVQDAPKPAAREQEVLEWFSIRKLGDNDYRVVKQVGPVLESATNGPQMTLPVEVWDRWQIDAEEMLSRRIAKW